MSFSGGIVDSGRALPAGTEVGFGVEGPALGAAAGLTGVVLLALPFTGAGFAEVGIALATGIVGFAAGLAVVFGATRGGAGAAFLLLARGAGLDEARGDFGAGRGIGLPPFLEAAGRDDLVDIGEFSLRRELGGVRGILAGIGVHPKTQKPVSKPGPAGKEGQRPAGGHFRKL